MAQFWPDTGVPTTLHDDIKNKQIGETARCYWLCEVAATRRHDLDFRTCPTKTLNYNPKQHGHAKENIFWRALSLLGYNAV
jgi:hypothetical protein